MIAKILQIFSKFNQNYVGLTQKNGILLVLKRSYLFKFLRDPPNAN